MIRKNVLFCKLIRIKSSCEALFFSFMEDFSPRKEECPVCHSRGNCAWHDAYDRPVIDILNGKPHYGQISVRRVICESCGHAHAILPDFLIPYRQYSLFFILRVLAEHLAGFRTVENICRLYGITRSMFYRWKHLFLKHRGLWLSILDASASPPLSFLKHLCRIPAFSAFAAGFTRLTGFSLLQGHKNPAAISRRRRC